MTHSLRADPPRMPPSLSFISRRSTAASCSGAVLVLLLLLAGAADCSGMESNTTVFPQVKATTENSTASISTPTSKSTSRPTPPSAIVIVVKEDDPGAKGAVDRSQEPENPEIIGSGRALSTSGEGRGLLSAVPPAAGGVLAAAAAAGLGFYHGLNSRGNPPAERFSGFVQNQIGKFLDFMSPSSSNFPDFESEIAGRRFPGDVQIFSTNENRHTNGPHLPSNFPQAGTANLPSNRRQQHILSQQQQYRWRGVNSNPQPNPLTSLSRLRRHPTSPPLTVPLVVPAKVSGRTLQKFKSSRVRRGKPNTYKSYLDSFGPNKKTRKVVGSPLVLKTKTLQQRFNGFGGNHAPFENYHAKPKLSKGFTFGDSNSDEVFLFGTANAEYQKAPTAIKASNYLKYHLNSDSGETRAPSKYTKPKTFYKSKQKGIKKRDSSEEQKGHSSSAEIYAVPLLPKFKAKGGNKYRKIEDSDSNENGHDIDIHKYLKNLKYLGHIADNSESKENGNGHGKHGHGSDERGNGHKHNGDSQSKENGNGDSGSGENGNGKNGNGQVAEDSNASASSVVFNGPNLGFNFEGNKGERSPSPGPIYHKGNKYLPASSSGGGSSSDAPMLYFYFFPEKSGEDVKQIIREQAKHLLPQHPRNSDENSDDHDHGHKSDEKNGNDNSNDNHDSDDKESHEIEFGGYYILPPKNPAESTKGGRYSAKGGDDSDSKERGKTTPAPIYYLVDPGFNHDKGKKDDSESHERGQNPPPVYELHPVNPSHNGGKKSSARQRPDDSDSEEKLKKTYDLKVSSHMSKYQASTGHKKKAQEQLPLDRSDSEEARIRKLPSVRGRLPTQVSSSKKHKTRLSLDSNEDHQVRGNSQDVKIPVLVQLNQKGGYKIIPFDDSSSRENEKGRHLGGTSDSRENGRRPALGKASYQKASAVQSHSLPDQAFRTTHPPRQQQVTTGQSSYYTNFPPAAPLSAPARHQKSRDSSEERFAAQQRYKLDKPPPPPKKKKVSYKTYVEYEQPQREVHYEPRRPSSTVDVRPKSSPQLRPVLTDSRSEENVNLNVRPIPVSSSYNRGQSKKTKSKYKSPAHPPKVEYKPYSPVVPKEVVQKVTSPNGDSYEAQSHQSYYRNEKAKAKYQPPIVAPPLQVYQPGSRYAPIHERERYELVASKFIPRPVASGNRESGEAHLNGQQDAYWAKKPKGRYQGPVIPPVHIYQEAHDERYAKTNDYNRYEVAQSPDQYASQPEPIPYKDTELADVHHIIETSGSAERQQQTSNRGHTYSHQRESMFEASKDFGPSWDHQSKEHDYGRQPYEEPSRVTEPSYRLRTHRTRSTTAFHNSPTTPSPVLTPVPIWGDFPAPLPLPSASPTPSYHGERAPLHQSGESSIEKFTSFEAKDQRSAEEIQDAFEQFRKDDKKTVHVQKVRPGGFSYTTIVDHSQRREGEALQSSESSAEVPVRTSNSSTTHKTGLPKTNAQDLDSGKQPNSTKSTSSIQEEDRDGDPKEVAHQVVKVYSTSSIRSSS